MFFSEFSIMFISLPKNSDWLLSWGILMFIGLRLPVTLPYFTPSMGPFCCQVQEVVFWITEPTASRASQLGTVPAGETDMPSPMSALTMSPGPKSICGGEPCHWSV